MTRDCGEDPAQSGDVVDDGHVRLPATSDGFCEYGYCRVTRRPDEIFRSIAHGSVR